MITKDYITVKWTTAAHTKNKMLSKQSQRIYINESKTGKKKTPKLYCVIIHPQLLKGIIRELWQITG